jgi:hypothetical protein
LHLAAVALDKRCKKVNMYLRETFFAKDTAMRTLYLLIVINLTLILTGCAHAPNTYSTFTEPADESPPPCHHHKDPVNVSFLKSIAPDRPYRILGQAQVAKFNMSGVKRQEATIRDLMREQAASLDGDAVVNIRKTDKMITATVIAYKKVLA